MRFQSRRSNNSHLYTVLVKHNIFYYVCGLYFLGCERPRIAALPCAPSDVPRLRVFILFFQFIVLAILATRMHLHLWHTDRCTYGSSTLMCIPFPV
ncbi:hypothetical protein EDD22DRAFT_890218 [Suillus occidentalis]|nr:hypothetical protein EDD22DRAFT_890218 [Suillus occidentalis]